MSFGEQNEASWLDLDEAVRIERTAANLATLVVEDSGIWLGKDARVGWGDHLLGESPDPARGANYMAGWLARQIWCHGRGDDSEHVVVQGEHVSEIRPCNTPLCAHISREGVLTIEIGIETLAHAALALDDSTPDEPMTIGDRHTIGDKRGFARDVMYAFLQEDEDGASPVTKMIDAAIERAIDDGSEYVDLKAGP